MTIIEPATRHDLPGLVDLLEEMDQFYGDTTEGTLEERARQLTAVLFGPTPKAAALLAKDGDQVVGLAAYSYLWPAIGISTSLYLKELYVRRDRRREGIGQQLMTQLVELAKAEGCTRVEWTTDDGNEVAQHFYETLGHAVNAGKLMYRIPL